MVKSRKKPLLALLFALLAALVAGAFLWRCRDEANLMAA